MMRKHYSTFDLAMMRSKDHMTHAEISDKTGIPVDEVKARIRNYHRQGACYASESYIKHESKRGNGHHNSDKHPERNSQYAEKGGT